MLGEELLFRGLLLPRMQGVFGRRDWVANGVLFAVYHLHQPWSILNNFVDGIFLLAYPSRRFQSAWMGIIAHSSRSVFVIAIVSVSCSNRSTGAPAASMPSAGVVKGGMASPKR